MEKGGDGWHQRLRAELKKRKRRGAATKRVVLYVVATVVGFLIGLAIVAAWGGGLQ